MCSRWFAAVSQAVLLAVGLPAAAQAATRPRYGGTLRVEVREAPATPDPPQSGPGMAQLNGPFTISEWSAGSRAVYLAAEDAPGGRPFVDRVEVLLGRPPAEQSIDLDLGKADIVEAEGAEPRRGPPRKIWASAPVRIVLLAFGPRVENAAAREALALAVDRAAIETVLLQRQGEISGALLPAWLSGYAFLFPGRQDLARARSLASSAPPAARTFSLGAATPALRRIADRIALNARDAGLTVIRPAPGAMADVNLVEIRILSADPARALAGVAAALGLAEPAHTETPEGLYVAERRLLDGFRIVPLFHLPDVYAAAPRVEGGPGITPLGEWRFESLWLEGRLP